MQGRGLCPCAQACPSTAVQLGSTRLLNTAATHPDEHLDVTAAGHSPTGNGLVSRAEVGSAARCWRDPFTLELMWNLAFGIWAQQAVWEGVWQAMLPAPSSACLMPCMPSLQQDVACLVVASDGSESVAQTHTHTHIHTHTHNPQRRNALPRTSSSARLMPCIPSL